MNTKYLVISSILNESSSSNSDLFNKIDLSKYERMYDSFDEGHNREHMTKVRNQAMILAEKYLPSKVHLVFIAATLHDIGLSVNRENHESIGANIVSKDPYFKTILSKSEINEIVHAISQHRASSGKPKTILAKIVSDADRSASTTSYTLYRAIAFGIIHDPGKTLDQYIERAAKHHIEKFGKDGYGRRTYFKETEIRLNKIFNIIPKVYNEKGIKGIWNLLNNTHQNKIKKLLKQKRNA